MSVNGEAALAYALKGVPVLPLHWPEDGACSCGDPACGAPAKHPLTEHGKDEATTNPETIRRWWERWPKANIGLRMGAGRLALDVHPRHGGDESLRDLGPLPDTVTALTGGGGQHLIYRADGPLCDRKGARPGLDIITVGYIVAPPSRHISGRREIHHAPGQIALAPLPPVIAALANDGRTPAEPLPGRIEQGRRNELLTSLAGSMRRRGASPEAIEAALLLENQTRRDPALPAADVQRIAHSIGRYLPAPQDGTGISISCETYSGFFRRTDYGNAELIAHLYGGRVRYDHRRRRWLLWQDHWWIPDADAEIGRMAKEAARHRYETAPRIDDLTQRDLEARWAIASESRQRLDAALDLATSERPLADSGQGWDADPWLLATANGVVDLRCGLLRDGRPEDRITMHSPIAYDPDAPCPRWLQFLVEVFANDDEMIDYIQRVCGYNLTGITREQCHFLCYGEGWNGKGTFQTVQREILGDYATNTPFSTLEASSRYSIPNDLAALYGKRLVTASELNEAVRLNEARLKMLAGEDPVTARFLHGEFFTFLPAAKFWLAVNHRPIVNDDSTGFWRKIRLIPFTQSFKGRADPNLKDALRPEYAGILTWMVDGCLEWQRRGLDPPQSVRAATEQYREESDPIAAFLRDGCVIGEDFTARAGQLYVAYRKWAQGQGLKEKEELSNARFGRLLTQRFPKDTDKQGIFYRGIGLVVDHQGGEN